MAKKNSIANTKNSKKVKKTKNLANASVSRKLKETSSELKKVTWPKFGKVAKQTGMVLAMVVIFTVVLFGIDQLLGLLFKVLVK